MAIYLVFFLFQWQQSVAYKIIADLDTLKHSLSAVEYLTYNNNSPNSLETLYVHLYANAYKDMNTTYAKEIKKLGEFGNKSFLKSKESERGYIEIENVIANGEMVRYEIDETIMSIFLDEPIASGDSIVLKIDFYLKIPKQFSRLGYQDHHYEMVQWYPKICVFDRNGWHRDAYHAIGEFYGEFGSFDVEINLPSNYIVAATGEKIDEIYKENKDSLSYPAGNNIDEKIETHKTKTVRFHAENVHDFAWICDPDFLVRQFEVDSINIFVFAPKHNRINCENVETYAVDALKRYNKWYGKYPYKNLNIVNGYFRGGMEYPNLVSIGPADDRLTRDLENVIIHEIGHQWFYGILGSNEMDEAWLDEGFTTYTEIRYFEDKYGKENSLFKLPFIPPLPRRYYHKSVYYLTQTNNLEIPILSPAYEFIDVPISYINGAYSKPALFLINLEGILGKEKFDKILKRYFEEYKFTHPRTEDFMRICEEESGQDLKAIFYQFLNTTGFCDWRIKGIKKNKIQFENSGNILMPVDVLVESDKEKEIFRLDGKSRVSTIDLTEWNKIRKVIIDPDGYTLETNYWNNYYPRKIDIKPIFNFPSFDSYQIFYLPYLWYSTYDGFTLGLYFFGAEFIDFDFVKGRHQWIAGCTYGVKSERLYPLINYQTPIIFKRGMRTRIALRGSTTSDEDKAGFGFVTNLGIPFSQTPQIEITNMLSYYKLNSYHLLDSAVWNRGKNIIFDNQFKLNHRQWQMNIGLAWANEIIGGEWNYLKTTMEIKKQFETFVPFNLRLFAGRIFGAAPTQEKLFLCGALRISLMADLLFSPKGYFSPQEHVHISGNGNMLGYQTMHIRSNEMYCLNIESPSQFPLRAFVDLGYYGEYAADFGTRIVLGPISFNFPFYTKTDEPWKLRWSIGF